jgi:ferredoxin
LRTKRRQVPNEEVAAMASIPASKVDPIRLVVDLNRCEAYAQCCFLAPSVFELHGEEALWYEPEPDEAQRAQVRRAAASCPVQAIKIELPEPAGVQGPRGARSSS